MISVCVSKTCLCASFLTKHQQKERIKEESKTGTQKNIAKVQISASAREFSSQCVMESPEVFGMERVEILSNTLNELIKGEVLPKDKTKDDCEIESMEKEPPKVIFRCNICEKNLSSKGNLKTHNNARHDPQGRAKSKKPRTFQCKKCVAAFKTPGQLKRHYQTTHDNSGPLQCEVCSVMLENKIKLRQHRVSHKERKYKCSMCDFKFSRPKKLDSHFLRVHTDLKKEECKVCGGFFNELDAHFKRRHTDINKKVCIVCGDVFKHLKNHLKRTACGLGKKMEATFNCELCTKKFTMKDGLKRHLKEVHEQIKKHACEQCEYRTFSRHNLKLHQGSIHSGVRPTKQQCPHCDKMPYNLDYHVSTYHSLA